MPVKATLLDNFNSREATFSALGFFVAIFIILIVGAAGPQIGNSYQQVVSVPCNPAAPCNATVPLSIGGLSPWNQVLYVTAQLQRPTVNGSGAVPSQTITWPQNWQLTAYGDGQPVVINASHISRFTCVGTNAPVTSTWGTPVNPAWCNNFMVFATPLLSYGSYQLQLSLDDPLAEFRALTNGGLDPGMAFQFSVSNVAEKYTTFEAGWKVAFIVLTTITWIIYIVSLFIGPGTKDAQGKRIPSSNEQIWVAVLGALLFFFNEPGFISYVYNPSVSLAGFSAFCTANFLAALLWWFLAMADNARLEGEAGLRWRVNHTRLPRGALYWIPKVFIIAVIWASGLSLYMFQRLAVLNDPAFSFTESYGETLVNWGFRFFAALAAVYILYLLVLIVLALNRFKHMAPSTRYLLAVSITTIFLVFIGLLTQTFATLRSTSGLFLTLYGTANIYIWSLMILMRPAHAPPEWTANTQGVLGEGGSGSTELALADAAKDLAEADTDLNTPPITRESWDALNETAQFEAVQHLQERLKASAARLHKRATTAVAAAEEAAHSSASASGSDGAPPAGQAPAVQVVSDGSEPAPSAGGKDVPADVIQGSAGALFTGSSFSGGFASGAAAQQPEEHAEAAPTAAAQVVFGMIEDGHMDNEAEAEPGHDHAAPAGGSPMWK